MPNAGWNGHLRANDRTALAVEHFIEAERVAQGTGANNIIVGFILYPERDPRHLLGHPFDRLEPRGQGEIPNDFPLVDQQRKVLVRRVLGQLGQHRLFAHSPALWG